MTFRVSLAAVKAAAYVKARAGLKFWAAVWYTLRYLQTAVLTLKYIRALLSVSVLKRIAMGKYDINDLRLFFENDLRFLDQF